MCGRPPLDIGGCLLDVSMFAGQVLFYKSWQHRLTREIVNIYARVEFCYLWTRCEAFRLIDFAAMLTLFSII